MCPPCLSSSRRWCRMSRFSSRRAPWRGSADFSGPYRHAPGCIGTRASSRQRRSSPSIGANLRSSTGSWRVIPSALTIIPSYKPSGSRPTTSRLRGYVAGPSAQSVSKNLLTIFSFSLSHTRRVRSIINNY